MAENNLINGIIVNSHEIIYHRDILKVKRTESNCTLKATQSRNFFLDGNKARTEKVLFRHQLGVVVEEQYSRSEINEIRYSAIFQLRILWYFLNCFQLFELPGQTYISYHELSYHFKFLRVLSYEQLSQVLVTG